jgi:hypothetical protein
MEIGGNSRAHHGCAFISVTVVLFTASVCLAQNPRSVLGLTVATAVPLTDVDVDEILKGVNGRYRCGPTFRRRGSVSALPPALVPIGGAVNQDEEMEALDRHPANVKVVPLIEVCKIPNPVKPPGYKFDPNKAGDYISLVGEWRGCHWDSRRSIIVVPSANLNEGIFRWAHELGHALGLPHRDEPRALMNSVPGVENTEFSPEECATLKKVRN